MRSRELEVVRRAGGARHDPFEAVVAAEAVQDKGCGQ